MILTSRCLTQLNTTPMVDTSLQQILMISLYSLMPQLHLQDFFVQISLLVNLVSISEMNTLDSRQLLSFRPAIKMKRKFQ